jgi:hypothetical protein
VCRGVVAVFIRAVLGFLRARGRDVGVANGRGGAVTVNEQRVEAVHLGRRRGLLDQPRAESAPDADLEHEAGKLPADEPLQPEGADASQSLLVVEGPVAHDPRELAERIEQRIAA